MAEPRPVDRFLGAGLMAVGGLMFALCGACTLLFTGSTVANNLRHANGHSSLTMAIFLYGLIGGLPTLGGFMLARLGWQMFNGRLRRGPQADVSSR
jgi:hypothetical protein